MTPEQIQIAKAFARCTFPPATLQKRFAASMTALAEQRPEQELTVKQDRYLRELAYRHRRQMPAGSKVIGDPQKTFSTLQWIAPELARTGKIRNEPWIPEHCAEAVALFNNQGMHTCATLLAVLHIYALDYMRQAPVIVLAISQGSKLHRKKERAQIAQYWGMHFERGIKLRDLMTELKLAFPLRALVGHSICPSYWPAIQELSKIAPSKLAQIIPKAGQGQRRWLGTLTEWSDQMARRFHNPSLHFEWAASVTNGDKSECHLSNVADFVGAHRDTFNPRWTLQRAEDETTRWHTELAKADHEQKFFLWHGIQWDDRIPYDGFKDELEIGEFTFVALRSGRELFEEGAAMHHCVGSYSENVVTGQSRIFSIRRTETGRRVATVELGVASGPPLDAVARWRVTQCKGPCNDPVSKSAIVASRYFAQIANAVESVAHAVADEHRSLAA